MKKRTHSDVQMAAFFTLLLCGTGGAGAAGAAPEGQPRQPDLHGYRRLGPLFYRPTLRVRSFGYDDNVFLEARDTQGDLTATLGPEVKGILGLGRRAWVVLHAAVDFTGYARNSSLDHFDNQRGADFTVWLGGLRLSAGHDRAHLLRRPSSEVDDRVRRNESATRVAGLYELTSATTLEAGLSHIEERYEKVNEIDYDPALGHTDSILELKGRHRVGPFTWAVLSASGGVQDGHARNDIRDLRKEELLLGFDFEQGAVIEGSVRLGACSVRTPGLATDLRQDFLGGIGRGDLELKASTRSRIRLHFRRGFPPSTYLDNVYFRNDVAEISWTREMTARSAAEAGIGRGRLAYPNPKPERRIDRIDEVFVGTKMLLGKKAVMGIRIGRWSRDSDVAGEDRDRLVIQQTVSIPL